MVFVLAARAARFGRSPFTPKPAYQGGRGSGLQRAPQRPPDESRASEGERQSRSCAADGDLNTVKTNHAGTGIERSDARTVLVFR